MMTKKTMQRIKTVLQLAVIILIVIEIIVYSAISIKRLYSYDETLRENRATATITDVYTKIENDYYVENDQWYPKPSNYMDVRYSVDGVEYEGIGLKYPDFQSYQKGGTVTVFYDMDHPNRCSLDSFQSKDWSQQSSLALLYLVMIVMATILGYNIVVTVIEDIQFALARQKIGKNGYRTRKQRWFDKFSRH